MAKKQSRFAALFFDWFYRIKTPLHNSVPKGSCCPRRQRRAVPARLLGRRFHPINTLKPWPFVLLNRILHHHRSAPTEAGAGLIAREIRHYEAVFTNQIFSPVKTYMRSRLVFEYTQVSSPLREQKMRKFIQRVAWG